MARFEIRYDLRNPDWAGVTTADRYRAALDQVAWAEEHGYKTVTLSEHHGCPDGYLPAALTFAAAVAARTERIRIRVAAVVAALHDPLRLAEEAAVVDNLSGGRLELVVANGYVPEEFAMFGRELADRVPAVVETLETLAAAWSGEPFEFRGRQVRVTPRPHRRPRPPLLLGGASAAAARRAAALADVFLPSTAEHWDTYRAAVVEAGGPDWGPIRGIGPRYVTVTEDPEAGWSAIARHVAHDRQAYGAWAAGSGAATGYHEVAGAADREDPEYRVLTAAGFADLLAELGPHGTLAVHPMMGGLPPEHGWETLRAIEACRGT